MEQAGSYRIEASREVVWRMLNDPAVLAKCIEGCESFEPNGQGGFEAVVRAKVGPVSATFHAQLQILEPDPPLTYSIAGQVKAGSAGFGRGSARVSLSEEGEATSLNYTVEGSVGGKLAQVGQRLIDATARKMADDFFAEFAKLVAPVPAPTPAPPAHKPGRPRLAWLVIGVAVMSVAVCLWLLKR